MSTAAALRPRTAVPPEDLSPDGRRLWPLVDAARLPRHIAVIMDGSGRWAARHHRPRVSGHLAGVRAVRATVETA
ncbi:MAG TPA: undecaprenyl diphosphate synthase family protein, partial [Terriglobales bacterium]|nr:undecaprenyl diphosphate synthase family protein [Terriglobales bacterium]